MKKVIVFCVFLLLLTNSLLYTSNQRGLVMVNEDKNNSDIEMLAGNMNSIDTFKNIIPQKTHVFLVGNNNYMKESGYPELEHCINDVALLKQIFIHCCKIGEANIVTSTDITLAESNREFAEFMSIIEEDSLVILFFSGHGDSDGSLVFTDGNKLLPKDLKLCINSFPQDTILIIDSCYAGNNEGIRDHQVKGQQFKDNCIRIYSALAHLTAKEITYKNTFFKQALPFYRDVLQMENIKGNGYFTALFGLFFAQYRLGENENISYADLVYYITNKGNIYTETLATTKNDGNKGAWDEAVYRLNQHPKIHPADENVAFIYPEHEYIILQKKEVTYRPERNHFSFISQTKVPIILGLYNESLHIGLMQCVAILYNIKLNRGIAGMGVLTGTQYSPTYSNVTAPFSYLLYPVALHGQYYSDFAGPLYFLINLTCGLGINHLVFSESPERNCTDIKFLYGIECAVGINPKTTFGLAASLQYMMILKYDDIFHMVLPGIHVVYNLGS